MALPLSDINFTTIKNYIGGTATDIQASALVGKIGLDKKSFWCPGSLNVDGSYNITLTPPGNNYKVGDFRLYDSASPTPYIGTASATDRTPGATTCNITIPIFPQNICHKFLFSNIGSTGYITVILYSNAGRTVQVGSQTISISYNTTSPIPTGHTRAATGYERMDSGPVIVTFTNFAPGAGDVTLYGDVFFSTLTGTKIASLYQSTTGNFSVLCHEQFQPYMASGTYYSPPPSGVTVMLPYVRDDNSKCAVNNNPALTYGSGAFAFYFRAYGVATPPRVYSGTCNLRMTITHPIYGPVNNVIATGLSLSSSNGVYVSGNLSSWSWGSYGTTWRYDSTAVITLESPSWGSYLTC